MSYTNYSYSKCPKCEDSSFEMAEETPKGSGFKLMFVRCSSCKTVVGVIDYFNIGNLVQELATKLKVPLN